MAENILWEMLTSWVFWMLGSIGISLLVLYVTVWAPREAGRRARRIPAASVHSHDDVPERDPLEPRVDVETAMVAALSVHGDRIEAAHKQLLEARVGTVEERRASLDRALLLLEEATTARPDSHDAAEGRAHVHLALAEIVEDPAEQDAELRRSAEAFLATTQLRPRELDAYLGAGAVWIRLGRRWDGAQAGEAFDIAAATYERAFEQARNNVALIRGWVVALDGLQRIGSDTYPKRRTVFDQALTTHRGGDHDLAAWARAVLTAAEPPAVPNVEPLAIQQRFD